MTAPSFDQRLSAVAEALQSAAVGLSGWDDALAVLAHATGAKSGELIGLGRTSFQVITEISAEEMESFTAANGHDPAVSSRVRAGMRAPLLRLLDEADFDTVADCRRTLAYGDVVRRLDIPFAQIVILHRSPEVTLGLSMLRTASAGGMPDEEKRFLSAAAEHVSRAVQFQMAAEARAMNLTAAGFEQADQAVFVLDRAGRVRAMSAPAEQLVREGGLRLKEGRLSTLDPSNALDLAIGRALRVRTVADQPPGPVLATDATGLAYTIEVMALPSSHGFDFEAGVLIMARPPRALERRVAIMAASVFGLTQAEAAVAGLLVAGRTAAEIALAQGVALGTIRTHIRRLFEKTGSRSQTALIAAIVARL